MQTVRVQPSPTHARTWWQAYLGFLKSPHESLLLKLAPLALIGVLPPEVISNAIPGLGLFDDLGYTTLAVIVVWRTMSRVKHYR